MRRLLVPVSIVGVLIATPAFADAGIPLIACIHPGLWLALPVVILLEGLVAAFVLRWKLGTATKVVVIGNLLSTLAGMPLKWLLVWGLTPTASDFLSAILRARNPLVTWENGTLLQKLAIGLINLPMDGWGPESSSLTRGWHYWCVLLIPFFLLSVLVEWRVAVRLVAKENRTRAALWAWTANGLSYALLVGLFWRLYGYTWWWVARP